jgi:hypothetical protein
VKQLNVVFNLIFIVGFHSVAYHKMYKSSRQTQLVTVLWASNKLVTKLHVSAPLSYHQVQDKGLKLVVLNWLYTLCAE